MIPKTYEHLNANERDLLAVLKSKGKSLRGIAEILKRARNAIRKGIGSQNAMLGKSAANRTRLAELSRR